MKRIILLIPLVLFSIIGFGVLQLEAQGSEDASWRVEFFNNPYLIGPAVATQQHGQFAFDWGINAPAANVPADDFSARISTDVFFPAGTYRFYMVNDDRAHLYVDFQSVINNWENNQVGQLRTVDVTLPGGVIHIQVDYREEEGAAYAFLDWENTADGIQGPNFQVPVPGSVVGGEWTAEYFANTNLSGPAFAIRGETSPSHNWGAGAPLPGMPADNFSARWTASQTFDGGTYTISVRADDGVRVYVDNILHINQWGLATGQIYTASIAPTPGNHLVRIEFFEAGGIAFLEYSRTQNARPPSAPTGAYAVVDTGRLNVRNMPTVVGSIVLTKINFGEAYPIIGVNANRTWWQIDVNGTRGWVSAPYVDAFNTQNVPVTDGSGPVTTPQLPVTNFTVTTIANLNIRSGPSASANRIGLIPVFDTAAVVGRNASSTWWFVEYRGTRGWVSAAFAPIQSGANVSTIPILG